MYLSRVNTFVKIGIEDFWGFSFKNTLKYKYKL